MDVVLQVGQAVTQVDVKDVTPLVTTTNSTLGHTLERQRIEQLPINGRSFSALLVTVPGIEYGNSNASGRIQSYGMRVNSNTTVFDGAPINEVWEGYDFGRAPGLDAVQEFRVETNNSSAKFSRPNTVILSSKSGTNQFHGSLFETNRNSGYGVARRREDTFSKAPFLNRNEFGGSAGGPLYIPKLYKGRNRTFFFVSSEGLRSVSYATGQYSVPTEAMRNGDFRGLADTQGRPILLYDPQTTDPKTWQRTPLFYRDIPNMIDPARITSLAKFLFSVTPLPNRPNVKIALGNSLQRLNDPPERLVGGPKGECGDGGHHQAQPQQRVDNLDHEIRRPSQETAKHEAGEKVGPYQTHDNQAQRAAEMQEMPRNPPCVHRRSSRR